MSVASRMLNSLNLLLVREAIGVLMLGNVLYKINGFIYMQDKKLSFAPSMSKLHQNSKLNFDLFLMVPSFNKHLEGGVHVAYFCSFFIIVNSVLNGKFVNTKIKTM